MQLVAVRILLYKKARFAFTTLGLGMLFLLSVAQVGLLIGWINTITNVIRHTDADIWLMSENNVSWDYGAAIPRHRIYQARNVEGVAQTEGVFVGWSSWKKPNGQRINVQIIGIDRNLVGGPWAMREGRVEDVFLPDSVIVDELFLNELGVTRLGETFELRNASTAKVRGICREVRTFTASPYVFTSMKNAMTYDSSFHDDDATYVLVRCVPGADPDRVARAIAAQVPGIEALTTRAMMVRSVVFWMVGTGMGLLVLTTAVLGVVVGAVVGGQTLFNITQESLGHYATLLALGFTRRQILACVLWQGMALSALGVLLGGFAFHQLARASASTPAPLEMTATVFAALVAVSVVCSLLGSFLSVRTVLRIDPAVVFRV